MKQFDPDDTDHLTLARTSRLLHERFADGSLFTGGHGYARAKLRALADKELNEIDLLMAKLPR